MSSLDLYMVKAIQNGFVNVEGKDIIITDTGKRELQDILEICFKFVNESNPTKDFIVGAVKPLEKMTGKKWEPMQLFKYMLQQLMPTDIQLLVFLMHEKGNDYKYLKSAMSEALGTMNELNEPLKKGLSVVRNNKQKLDS